MKGGVLCLQEYGFWIIYVLFVILGLFFGWPPSQNPPGNWRPFGLTIIIFVLIGILGFGVFGPPIR